MMMLGWDIGLRVGWNTSLGSGGKNLEHLLEPDLWDDYKSTYVDYDYDKLWESLFLFHKIFSHSAKFVAKNFGYSFPADKADKVWAFLHHVRSLPEDAKTIY